MDTMTSNNRESAGEKACRSIASTSYDVPMAQKTYSHQTWTVNSVNLLITCQKVLTVDSEVTHVESMNAPVETVLTTVLWS